MADPITMALVGAGLGTAKYAGDVAGNASDKKVAATYAKWSPWTGAQKSVRKANLAGDIIPTAALGLALGNSMGGDSNISPWAAAAKASGDPGDFMSGLAGYGPTAQGAPMGMGGLGDWTK